MIHRAKRRKSLKRKFIDEAFDGDHKSYKKARQDDYCKVQFEWSCWIDALCKNGEITTKQYEEAVF